MQPQLTLHPVRSLFLIGLLGSTTTAMILVCMFVASEEWRWQQAMVGAISFLLPCFGITVYFHRYLTHSSFRFTELGKWTIQPILGIAANMAMQSKASFWVMNHVRHHAHSDQEGDVHSPRHGFWWSHVGWIMFVPEPDVAAFNSRAQSNSVARFLNHELVFLITGPLLALSLSYLAAGWQGMVWYLAAIGVLWHGTACINSVCHQHPHGYRNQGRETSDFSTNNVVLGLFALGEGWHHNHHQDQKSACFARRWWEIDLGYCFIKLMQWVQFVTDVRSVHAS